MSAEEDEALQAVRHCLRLPYDNDILFLNVGDMYAIDELLLRPELDCIERALKWADVRSARITGAVTIDRRFLDAA